MKWMFGLRGRLTAALLAVSTLTLAATAVFLLVPLDRQLREDALASLERTARASKPAFDALPSSAVRRGSPQLERIAEDLRRRTAAEIIVVDARERVLLATSLDRGERFTDVARALREGRSNATVRDTVEEGEAQIAIPLDADGRPFGLAVRKSLTGISSAQAVVVRALAVAGLIALAIALLVGLGVATRLVRRLTALRDTTRRVAELGPIAEIHADGTRDEVGDLTRAFATMQTRLREQERARRTFVATASHELRTPLTSLGLMLHAATEELDATEPDLAEARDQLGRALGQSERLSKLAAELLDLSRLDAGLPLRSELVELGALARSVIAEFAPRTDGTRTTVELQAGEARWVIADPGSVAQILRILFDNALRHAPAQTPVTVDVGASDGRPTIIVADVGSGVAAQDAERIFERFERGSDVRAGGFGLGLAIGRELARKLGGDLRLAADDGPGARFVLTLWPAPAMIDEPV